MPIRCASSPCAIATRAPGADAIGCSPVLDRETLIQVIHPGTHQLCRICTLLPVRENRVKFWTYGRRQGVAGDDGRLA